MAPAEQQPEQQTPAAPAPAGSSIYPSAPPPPATNGVAPQFHEVAQGMPPRNRATLGHSSPFNPNFVPAGETNPPPMNPSSVAYTSSLQGTGDYQSSVYTGPPPTVPMSTFGQPLPPSTTGAYPSMDLPPNGMAEANRAPPSATIPYPAPGTQGYAPAPGTQGYAPPTPGYPPAAGGPPPAAGLPPSTHTHPQQQGYPPPPSTYPTPAAAPQASQQAPAPAASATLGATEPMAITFDALNSIRLLRASAAARDVVTATCAREWKDEKASRTLLTKQQGEDGIVIALAGPGVTPWCTNKKTSDWSIGRNLIRELFSDLYSCGLVVSSSFGTTYNPHLGKDTVVFSPQSTPTEPGFFFTLTIVDSELVRVVGADPAIIKEIGLALKGAWEKGVKSEKTEHSSKDKCNYTEWKLKGSPFNGRKVSSSEGNILVAIQSRLLKLGLGLYTPLKLTIGEATDFVFASVTVNLRSRQIFPSAPSGWPEGKCVALSFYGHPASRLCLVNGDDTLTPSFGLSLRSLCKVAVEKTEDHGGQRNVEYLLDANYWENKANHVKARAVILGILSSMASAGYAPLCSVSSGFSHHNDNMYFSQSVLPAVDLASLCCIAPHSTDRLVILCNSQQWRSSLFDAVSRAIERAHPKGVQKIFPPKPEERDSLPPEGHVEFKLKGNIWSKSKSESMDPARQLSLAIFGELAALGYIPYTTGNYLFHHPSSDLSTWYFAKPIQPPTF